MKKVFVIFLSLILSLGFGYFNSIPEQSADGCPGVISEPAC